MDHDSPSFQLAPRIAAVSVVLALTSPVTPTSNAHADTLVVPSVDYPTIQSAIDAADPADTVLVAPGTYTGTDNKNLDFGGTDLVLLSQGGPSVTIIDCEDDGRGVHFHSGETNAAVLRGFTIRQGLTDVGETGAGIYCDDSSPTITECVITDCRTSASVGGGISVESASPRISFCSITGNNAQTGAAGIFIAAGSSPTVEDCEIRNNETDQGSGGGMSIQDSSPTLSRLLVTGNRTGDSGGGISVLLFSAPTITSVTLAGNHASVNGGGFFSGLYASNVLEQSIVWGNCADGSGDEIYLANQGGTGGETQMICSAVDPAGVAGDADVTYVGEQVFADPAFCGPEACTDAPTEAGDYTLDASSPCLAENSPCGGRIGALGEGCKSTPTESVSWGRLKSRF